MGPWITVKGNIRAVEFCKVESLEYATASGSGDSCCKMTLKFIDPTSSVSNMTFRLTLPEVTGFPDFLVERTRFDAAIQRNWTCRDKCKVWWKNESDEDGSWWDGRVLSVKPKSSEFPDSPWERYTVQYKTEPTETHLHSPWELFDSDTQWEQPRIDDDNRNKLLSAFAKLEQSANRVQVSIKFLCVCVCVALSDEGVVKICLNFAVDVLGSIWSSKIEASLTEDQLYEQVMLMHGSCSP